MADSLNVWLICRMIWDYLLAGWPTIQFLFLEIKLRQTATTKVGWIISIRFYLRSGIAFFLFFICINLENYRLSQSRNKELGFLPRR